MNEYNITMEFYFEFGGATSAVDAEVTAIISGYRNPPKTDPLAYRDIDIVAVMVQEAGKRDPRLDILTLLSDEQIAAAESRVAEALDEDPGDEQDYRYELWRDRQMEDECA